jgi:uncharacterized metal-binding protein/predicted Fe-Mo cluster-binding NifX family protein
MRYGIPLLKDRVSPRCTIADSVMLVSYAHGRLESHRVIHLESGAWTGLIQLLLENQVDTVVAGGINRETRQMLTSYGLEIVDNVACSADELLEAVAHGRLHPGYGFSERPIDKKMTSPIPADSTDDKKQETSSAPEPWETQDGKLVRFDCLSCTDRVCLRGEVCYPAAMESYRETAKEHKAVLEAARDISCEEDRKLCRVAELVYFCLGMKFKRLGVAFCLDLTEPAGILVGLLRRFFDVFPVCCKVGGIPVTDPLIKGDEHRDENPLSGIACNPVGQAEVLNRLGTDINIIVGLCMGVDSLFTQASLAPVTTLFVKDKSLVNNPIGAIYSDYYLHEVTRAPASENVHDS